MKFNTRKTANCKRCLTPEYSEKSFLTNEKSGCRPAGFVSDYTRTSTASYAKENTTNHTKRPHKEHRNKEEDTSERRRKQSANNETEMGRPCSKTRPPSLGTRNNSMGHKERTTGTWKTNYEMGGRHEETSRKPTDQNSEEQEGLEKLRESDKSTSVSASVSARVYESSRHR
jgi:hypothetical protein